MKQTMRRLGIEVLSAVGPRLPGIALRRRVCDRMVPYLMDDEVLPRGLWSRRLSGHPVRVLCDPYVYNHRAPFWCGHLFEEELERYLRREMRRGDTFIDVGCNVGQVSVLAAAIVGTSGRVHAFEANPALAAIASRHAHQQGLPQLLVHDFGLGAEAATFPLRFDPEHDGGGTLRPLHDDDQTIDAASFTSRIECRVKPGDEVLLPLPTPGRVFLKIDVEGHEPSVIRGMEQVLAERVDHAVIEVSPEWIGGSEGVLHLFSQMKRCGLDPFEITATARSATFLPPTKSRHRPTCSSAVRTRSIHEGILST